ncbi:MAG: glycosyltransferase family 4 protein [Halobacteriota archaeon]
MKEKVILANTHSFSSFLPDFRVKEEINELPYGGGWHVRLAQQIAKCTDRYDLECWSIEKRLEKEFTTKDDNILYRFFPAQYIGSKRINLGEVSWPLLRELRIEVKKQHSLVHLHSAFTWATVFASLFIKKTPILVQCYEERPLLQLFLETPERQRYGYLASYLLKVFFFERALKKRVDCFLVLNKPTEKYFSRLVGAEKVHISPMGVDFSVYRRIDKNRARDDLGLDSDKKYVLSVAAMVERKGLDYLIRSMPTIRESLPDTELLLVGEGRFKKQLELLANRLHIQDAIHFIPAGDAEPRVPDEKLPLYYNAADVFVLPSLTEALGVVGIEAMACGTPFIGTNVEGIPSLVEQFEAGVLIPPRDPNAIASAVIKVLEDVATFSANRERAKSYFDWHNVAKKNIDFYAALFDKYYGGSE